MASGTETTAKGGAARWIYWIFTGLICVFMLMGGIQMLAGGKEALEGLQHLGYPAYFAKILGLAKVLGVLALLVGRPRQLKEWAYAGFTFNLLAASASHVFSHDEIWHVIVPLVLVAVLLATYRQWKAGRV